MNSLKNLIKYTVYLNIFVKSLPIYIKNMLQLGLINDKIL